MTLLRGTKKLLRLLEVGAGAMLEPEDEGLYGRAVFREWYANAISVEGGHVVLFVHSPTRLAVVVPAGERRRVENAFLRRVVGLFRRLSFPAEFVRSETGLLEPVTYSRTGDRSMVGSMNDIAFHLRDGVEGLVPGFGARMSEFELEMSRLPHRPLGGRLPVDVARDLIEAWQRQAGAS